MKKKNLLNINCYFILFYWISYLQQKFSIFIELNFLLIFFLRIEVKNCILNIYKLKNIILNLIFELNFIERKKTLLMQYKKYAILHVTLNFFLTKIRN